LAAGINIKKAGQKRLSRARPTEAHARLAVCRPRLAGGGRERPERATVPEWICSEGATEISLLPAAVRAGCMAEYKVKFEVFEGPLDLLLYLIKKEEVDIYRVNLTQLATQFIEYLDLMRLLDLEIAGEFLVMAATLMYIKSCELLPADQQALIEGEEEGEDPRWELIRQLVEYKKFKDAAAQLQVLEARQENVFPRLPGKLDFEPAMPPPRPDVSLFDLLSAVNAVLKHFDAREDLRDIFEDKWTVSEKIEALLRLVAEKGLLKFSELFAGVTSRSEVVVTFLALLELMRLKQLVAAQSMEFGEIQIARAPTFTGTPPAPAPETAAQTLAPVAAPASA
jgi:segregation and condensation protein A